jgi:hypothetical protein
MPQTPRPAFILKAEIPTLESPPLAYAAQKTMYAGKQITPGDTIFIFASETQGGPGLLAKATVTTAIPTPRPQNTPRHTPRVSITIANLQKAKSPLGRATLKPFRDWNDNQPQTELNFKLYRQATNKIVGITPATAAFLETHF